MMSPDQPSVLERSDRRRHQRKIFIWSPYVTCRHRRRLIGKISFVAPNTSVWGVNGVGSGDSPDDNTSFEMFGTKSDFAETSPLLLFLIFPY